MCRGFKSLLRYQRARAGAMPGLCAGVMPCRRKGTVRFSKNTVSLFNNKKRFCEKIAGSGIILCRRKAAQNVLNSGKRRAAGDQSCALRFCRGLCGRASESAIRPARCSGKKERFLYILYCFFQQNSRNLAKKSSQTAAAAVLCNTAAGSALYSQALFRPGRQVSRRPRG